MSTQSDSDSVKYMYTKAFTSGVGSTLRARSSKTTISHKTSTTSSSSSERNAVGSSSINAGKEERKRRRLPEPAATVGDSIAPDELPNPGALIVPINDSAGYDHARPGPSTEIIDLENVAYVHIGHDDFDEYMRNLPSSSEDEDEDTKSEDVGDGDEKDRQLMKLTKEITGLKEQIGELLRQQQILCDIVMKREDREAKREREKLKRRQRRRAKDEEGKDVEKPMTERQRIIVYERKKKADGKGKKPMTPEEEEEHRRRA